MSETKGPQSRSFVYIVSKFETVASKKPPKSSSVISELHAKMTSPVSSSTISLANEVPTKKSLETFSLVSFAVSIWRICREVILRPSSTISFPFLSLIGKLKTSPRKRDGIRLRDTSGSCPFLNFTEKLLFS